MNLKIEIMYILRRNKFKKNMKLFFCFIVFIFVKVLLKINLLILILYLITYTQNTFCKNPIKDQCNKFKFYRKSYQIIYIF